MKFLFSASLALWVLFSFSGCGGMLDGLRAESAAIDAEADRDRDSDYPRERAYQPKTLRGLSANNVNSYDPPVQRGYGRSSAAGEIMNLLKTVEALPKSELPPAAERYRGPSPKGAVGDLIRVLLKAVSEEHGVAARILATSDDIDAIVLDDHADVPALHGWRRKLFGDKALAIKHGRLGLAASRRGIVEVPITES